MNILIRRIRFIRSNNAKVEWVITSMNKKNHEIKHYIKMDKFQKLLRSIIAPVWEYLVIIIIIIINLFTLCLYINFQFTIYKKFIHSLLKGEGI